MPTWMNLVLFSVPTSMNSTVHNINMLPKSEFCTFFILLRNYHSLRCAFCFVFGIRACISPGKSHMSYNKNGPIFHADCSCQNAWEVLVQHKICLCWKQPRKVGKWDVLCWLQNLQTIGFMVINALLSYSGMLTDLEFAVLSEWFDFLTTTQRVDVDLFGESSVSLLCHSLLMMLDVCCNPSPTPVLIATIFAVCTPLCLWTVTWTEICFCCLQYIYGHHQMYATSVLCHATGRKSLVYLW